MEWHSGHFAVINHQICSELAMLDDMRCQQANLQS